jgi:hypothetical protein
MSQKNRLLWIPTSDLRIIDNPTFEVFRGNDHGHLSIYTKAIEKLFNKGKYISEVQVCIDPRQATKSRNKYFNKRVFDIFRRASNELLEQTRSLGYISRIVDGSAMETIEPTDVVIMTIAYTPFAKERANEIMKIVGKNSLIQVPSNYLTENLVDMNKKYKKYSAFRDSAVLVLPAKFKIISPGPTVFGTLREKALNDLNGFDIDKYRRTAKASVSIRSGATNVSWALARGIISPREVYNHCNTPKILYDITRADELEELIKPQMTNFTRELLFRDFYAYVTFWFMKRESNGSIAPLRNDDVKWSTTVRNTTDLIYIIGRPRVPEVIKKIYSSLIKTGKLSNYGRMIFATWLYDMNINWRIGEMLFAQELADYDFSSNHWNWAHHSIQGFNYQWPGKKYKIENIEYI